MKRIRIYPYKLYSEGARALATALDSLCVKPDGNYKPRENDLIVNWGNSHNPETWSMENVEVLNPPNDIKKAVNKLTTFEYLRLANIPTPEWTTDISVAERWLGNDWMIVERHNLTGSKGDGISIKGRDDPLENAPLYTKLIERAREYRVHVFDGQVIDLQQKKRREGNDSDGTIKNLDHGWVFVRDEITPPPRSIFDVAVRAVQALGLDFGGVDILTKDGECYVLEVNTAIGLHESTITSYVNAIKRYANN